MTQEEKQLLFKDLCARLPYDVKCLGKLPKPKIRRDIPYTLTATLLDSTVACGCKPYLRPMSTMTDEEDLEFIGLGATVSKYGTGGNAKHLCVLSIKEIDWLNAHHFDYRGLIEKGLALEAPEDMYKND